MKDQEKKKEADHWPKTLIQRRVGLVDHQRPQRWNWYYLVRPLDKSLIHQSQQPLSLKGLRSLRFFWIDGFFAAISENFYLGFIALYALAYGASNSQVGGIAATANLLGALSLFPGARLIEKIGQRKSIVIWSAGGFGRLALLLLALIPLLISEPAAAILAIILFNGLRSFMSNLANPAWTSIVADIVPGAMRSRFFASRNTAMGLAALLIAPLAGRIISTTNAQLESHYAGFQVVFVLAFIFGMVSTVSFQRIDEPPLDKIALKPHRRGDLRRAINKSRGFMGLVISAFVWNLALQIAAPFFNVYLVTEFQAPAITIGILAGIASLSALVGLRVFGRLMDRKGAYWVQTATGLIIPFAPLAWAFITAPWQVGIINSFTGFLWAGYNLANFNLLLELTPDDQRPRAVALFQTAVFSSAVIGPLLGGYLADIFGFQLIFGLSSIGRFTGMFLFLWLTVWPQKMFRKSADPNSNT